MTIIFLWTILILIDCYWLWGIS